MVAIIIIQSDQLYLSFFLKIDWSYSTCSNSTPDETDLTTSLARGVEPGGLAHGFLAREGLAEGLA